MWYNKKYIGDSPSGKAVGSGPTIRGFESLISSQVEIIPPRLYSLGGFYNIDDGLSFDSISYQNRYEFFSP